MDRGNLLLIADSEHNADMLYAVGMFVPDPFIYLRLQGKCHIVMNDLEIDRARKQAPHCRVLSFSQYTRRLRVDGVSRLPRLLVSASNPGFGGSIIAAALYHGSNPSSAATLLVSC